MNRPILIVHIQPGLIAAVNEGFLPLLIIHIIRNIVCVPIFIPCSPFPDLTEVFIKVRYGGTSAIHMKGRGCYARFKVLHGEHLPVKALAYVGSMGIQCCHNLIFFHIQIIEAVLLCCGTEIGFFRHNQPPRIVL